VNGRIKSHGWREIGEFTLHDGVADLPGKAFAKGPCRVLVSHEDHSGKMRWHLSISCRHRYPGWEEIKDARYALLPLGMTFAQILPPLTEYINVHPNCFHLWQIDEGEW
jgi:hypothetical protein